MRSIVPVLALLLLLPGCTDSLGIGSGCAGEKAATRLRLGTPDRIEEGVRSEFWVYNAERLAFTFTWGPDGEDCQVSESRFVRVPPAP